MNKQVLTQQLARVSKTSPAEAADYLDQAVFSILKRWKHGKRTCWPGLGVFYPEIEKRAARRTAKTEAP